MKTLSQVASLLNQARLESLGNPSKAGFHVNSRGIMQKSVNVKVLLRTKDKIVPLGKGTVCYADQDINENSTAATLVRSNRWKSYDVGNLWLFISGITRQLAQIDPSGEKTFASGFFTDRDELILDK